MHKPADGYEEKYMAAGSAFARTRQRMDPSYHVVLGIPFLALLAAIAVTQVYPLLALVPLLLLVWILFLYLRVTVTATHVHIQVGLFGPKIPIRAIEDARIGEYDSAKYGDKVIRTASDGSTAYYVGCKRGVEITYRTEKGSRTKVFASCEDAAMIVDGIERARAAAAPKQRVEVGTGQRVAAAEVVEARADDAELESRGGSHSRAD